MIIFLMLVTAMIKGKTNMTGDAKFGVFVMGVIEIFCEMVILTNYVL